MVEVHLDGLTKRYGETTALADVDVDVRDGEFFTLVGPSGCGKTTTLRTIAGFEAPSAGTVRFGDRDVTDVPPEDRDVGIVFQSYALFPHMSVGENVGYGLQFRDPPGDVGRDERIANLLELVDLAGFEDRDPEALSGGQRQRVALARALAPGPQVLLLDEPMSALDARLRERLRRQVKRIQSELGITTVYVTHDQEEALAISDRVAVMHDGRVEQVGRPREVYRRPATEFVARFVGENNVFEGEVVAAGDDAGAVDDRGRATPAREGARTGPDGDRSAEQESGGASDAENVAVVDVDGTAFRVTGGEAVAGSEGRTTAGDGATFCVRPADLRIGAETNPIDVEIVNREFLGEVVRLHAEWEDRRVVVRAPDPPDDDRLTVGFAPGDARIVATD